MLKSAFRNITHVSQFRTEMEDKGNTTMEKLLSTIKMMHACLWNYMNYCY